MYWKKNRDPKNYTWTKNFRKVTYLKEQRKLLKSACVMNKNKERNRSF